MSFVVINLDGTKYNNYTMNITFVTIRKNILLNYNQRVYFNNKVETHASHIEYFTVYNIYDTYIDVYVYWKPFFWPGSIQSKSE